MIEDTLPGIMGGVAQKITRNFSSYALYVSGNEQKWFHKEIAKACQAVYEGRIKKLMLFIPPQHGKSSLASQMFPAWVIGNNPAYRIINASYSADLATSFAKTVQRIITDDRHTIMFGNPLQGVDGLVKNADYFELARGGFYKAVGVGGALTGRPADIAIIDDPVKDAMEAHSVTYRNRVWDWYVNVLETRLHNNSGVILIQTRWHDDDLSGRLIKHEAKKWHIIRIPAIREDNENPADPRHVGEALWPEKHSLERLLEQKARSERTFAALYQQRPSVDGGNIIRSDWFQIITAHDLHSIRNNAPLTFFVDTAFTDQQKNDPTGIIGTVKLGANLYITAAAKVRMTFPELVRWMPNWAYNNGYSEGSSIRIEPKANGISVIQQLRATTGMNISQTPAPTEGKETRLNVASPTVECGRVYLVDGSWNDEFITEVCGFPSTPHDEYVDLLCYAIDHHIGIKNNTVGNLGRYFF